MSKQIFLAITLASLAACDNQESESQREARDAADKAMLQGEFKKSPVLDFSKYTTDSPESAKPAKEAPKPKPDTHAEGSGFKKSPTLDFRKYFKEDKKP